MMCGCRLVGPLILNVWHSTIRWGSRDIIKKTQPTTLKKDNADWWRSTFQHYMTPPWSLSAHDKSRGQLLELLSIDHLLITLLHSSHLRVFVDPKPQLFQLWRPALLPLVIVHPWSSLFFSYFLVSLSLAFISAPPNRLLVLLLPNINQSQKLVLAPHYVITFLHLTVMMFCFM